MNHLKRIYQELIVVLAMLSLINMALYVYYPNMAVPIYKQLRTYLHDSKAKNNAEVLQIFNKIKRLLPGEHVRNVRLVILADTQVNAWVSTTGTVVMTTGFLNIIEYDKGMIASTFGHELAHFILGHTEMPNDSKKPKQSGVLLELLADDLGILLAMSAGYNGCNEQELWDKLTETYGMNLYTSSHPTHDSRAKNLERLCKNII